MLKRSSARTSVSFSVLIPMVLLGCWAATASGETAPSPRDTILFDIFYNNNASGFDCRGRYIDASGTVHHYDCRALGVTIRTPAFRGRREMLLQHRYGMKDSVVCHIGVKELTHARKLVREAAKMPPLEGRGTARDAGSTAYMAFLYDPGGGKRTDVPLATYGDWTCDPSTTAADQLVKWLKEVCSRKDTVGR